VWVLTSLGGASEISTYSSIPESEADAFPVSTPADAVALLSNLGREGPKKNFSIPPCTKNPRRLGAGGSSRTSSPRAMRREPVWST
jgi:hypothetical protein